MGFGVSVATALTASSEIDRLNAINNEVCKKVKEKTGFHPRTKVVGFSDTFTVDVSTGNMFVIPGLDPKTSAAYMTHESGHRVCFPVSSAGSMAFISAVKVLAKDAPNEEVVAAANIVADVFSDSVLLYQGLGEDLVKRIPDFMNRARITDLGMAFKVLMYKAIEKAVEEGRNTLSRRHVDQAYESLARVYGDSGLLRTARSFGGDFIDWLNSFLQVHSPPTITKYLLNPFRAGSAPPLYRLASLAAKLIKYNTQLDGSPISEGMKSHGQSSGAGSGSGDRQQQQQQDSNNQGGGGSSQEDREQGKNKQSGSEGSQHGREENKSDQTKGSEQRGGQSREGQDQRRPGSKRVQPGARPAEGVDIMPSKVNATDVQLAMTIMRTGFGMHPSEASFAMQAVFSDKIKEAVKELINKVKMVFSQNDFTVYKPVGHIKKQSELWLRPWGEPDEDSMIMEQRKLMWTMTYRTPANKGRPRPAPVSVPEKVVVVMDESGSTGEEFYDTTVASVEAFVSIVALSGLRYKNGAKKIDVIKFSDRSTVTYSGDDEVAAGVNILMPHEGAGGGTNIVEAVERAIGLATNNTAVIVVTDAVISEEEAERIATSLRKAVDTNKVGFVVFIVVNKEDIPSINIIKSRLSGKNAVVGHIKNGDDVVQVAQGIVSHILRVYSS
mgnify:CR=1 FL=1